MNRNTRSLSLSMSRRICSCRFAGAILKWHIQHELSFQSLILRFDLEYEKRSQSQQRDRFERHPRRLLWKDILEL